MNPVLDMLPIYILVGSLLFVCGLLAGLLLADGPVSNLHSRVLALEQERRDQRDDMRDADWWKEGFKE